MHAQTFQNNGLSEKRIENFDIEIGKTSKKYLITKYGPPIFEGVFNNNIIYYISHQTSYKTFNERKTNELLVFEITLDNNNIVKDYRQYTKKDTVDLKIHKNQDEFDLNMTTFWKDFITALTRTNKQD